jgi:hypothetical protein
MVKNAISKNVQAAGYLSLTEDTISPSTPLLFKSSEALGMLCFLQITEQVLILAHSRNKPQCT